MISTYGMATHGRHQARAPKPDPTRKSDPRPDPVPDAGPDAGPGPRSAAAAARATARPLLALCLAASVLSALFVLSYGYALHAPQPHGVRIDVVGSRSADLAVTRGLAAAQPGGFRVRAVRTAAVARHAVADGRVYGAVLPAGPGAVELVTASAAGVPVRQVVVTAVTAVEQRQGLTVRDLDVRPLPAADRAGQSGFVLEIGLLIPGVIGSIGFYLLGRRVRLWLRVAAAAGYAALAAVFGVLVLDLGLGALTGSAWTLAATGALVAWAFVLTVAACHTVLGLPGTALAAGVLLVVGNAANGSTVPVPLLPAGYRQVAPWLPNGAAVRAFRADVYFAGHGQGQPMLALALWVAGALVVIVLADLLHLRRRRSDPGRHEQIHATPVVASLRRRRPAAAPRIP